MLSGVEEREDWRGSCLNLCFLIRANFFPTDGAGGK